MSFYYHFAGMDFQVDMPQGREYTNHRHLEPFRVDAVQDPHRFSYHLVEALPAPAGRCVAEDPAYRVYADGDACCNYIGVVADSWQGAYMRAAHRGKCHQVEVLQAQVRERLGVHTVLGAMQPEHLITEVDGFLFHAAFIDHQGQGILFTAPSGTGKSTQAELWKALRGARIINGDRAAVRLADGGILAEGIPFCGSSEYCENASLPLRAIVYLRQGPETTITRLSGFRAFRSVWEGCSINTWNARDVARVSETVEQVVKNVPVYLLSCTPDESAVIALERMLRE